MIKAAVFDIDNTLYNYDTANSAAMSAVCGYTEKEFGWSSEETSALVKDVYDSMRMECGQKTVIHNRLIRFQKMLEQKHLPLSPHALRMYDIYWDTLIASSALFPDLVPALKELKALGIRLGIGTNMTAVIQFRKLEALGILGFFDFIVSSEEAGSEKPEKDIFLLCCQKAGVDPCECAFIGDSLKNDAAAAAASGMKGIWFDPDKDLSANQSPEGGNNSSAPKLPDGILRFREFMELPGLISNIK